MAEITQQHTPVQTPVAKPKTAVPGQQTVYHVPPGQDHTSRQQPIQYHTPATGQSPPAGQQPAQYYAPSPGQPVTPRPLISTSQRPAVELDLDFDYLKTPAGALLCTEFVSTAPNWTEQNRAEQSRAEQSRAEQSRTEQSRAERSRTEQNLRAEQKCNILVCKKHIQTIPL